MLFLINCLYHFGRITDHYTVRRDIFHHHRTGSHDAIISDCNFTDHYKIGTYHYIIPYNRRIASRCGRPNCCILMKLYIVSNLCPRMNNKPDTVSYLASSTYRHSLRNNNTHNPTEYKAIQQPYGGTHDV